MDNHTPNEMIREYLDPRRPAGEATPPSSHGCGIPAIRGGALRLENQRRPHEREQAASRCHVATQAGRGERRMAHPDSVAVFSNEIAEAVGVDAQQLEELAAHIGAGVCGFSYGRQAFAGGEWVGILTELLQQTCERPSYQVASTGDLLTVVDLYRRLTAGALPEPMLRPVLAFLGVGVVSYDEQGNAQVDASALRLILNFLPSFKATKASCFPVKFISPKADIVG